LACLKVFSEAATKLDEFEAFDRGVKEAGEGNNANDKTRCLCHVDTIDYERQI